MNTVLRPKNLKKYRNWTPIVVGILRKSGEVLVGLKTEGPSSEAIWEFPGTTIDQDENPEQALRRGLLEKIGTEAEVSGIPVVHTHSTAARGVLLLFYQVDFWKGEPKRIHYGDLQWIGPRELENLQVSESLKGVLSKLQTLIEQPVPSYDSKEE